LSDMSLIYFILRPLSTSGHASFVVDGARDATQEGNAAASVTGKASPRPELENNHDQNGQGPFRIFCSANLPLNPISRPEIPAVIPL